MRTRTEKAGTDKTAFYALGRGTGGFRDWLTLLHPPYTLWHLSYVAIGAALAPQMKWGVLGWTVLAFLLALGVGAHALDELSGRPPCSLARRAHTVPALTELSTFSVTVRSTEC